MTDIVRMEDLREGDILLYRGTGFISKAIQLFDGTDVSHVSVYMGDGKVGEAIAEGLVERSVRDSVVGNEWVKVFRLVNNPGDYGPVITCARGYLDQGNRYAYEQLVILGLLCTTRKLSITPILRRLLRTLLDAASASLTAMVSQNRQPMICSEFAYRAYDETQEGPDHPYVITIPGILPLEPEEDGMVVRAMVPQAAAARVHPESLAALFAAPASRTWLQPTERALPAPQVAESVEPKDELQILLEAYSDELQHSRVGMEDLQASTDRFALSLYAADESAAGAGVALAHRAAETSAAYEHLFRVAGDFVTPGDLYTTPSLRPVGVIAV
jgi:hypothetical protein